MLGLHISEHERGFKGGESMKVQPVKPITQVYFNQHKPVGQPTRKEINIRAKVVEEKPDAEASFNRMSQVLIKAFPWFMVMVVIYLAAQLSRALANGWLP